MWEDQTLSELIAGDQAAGPFQERSQNMKGLLLKNRCLSVVPQFPGMEVQLELSEAKRFGRGVWRHEHSHRASVSLPLARALGTGKKLSPRHQMKVSRLLMSARCHPEGSSAPLTLGFKRAQSGPLEAAVGHYQPRP